MFSNDYRKNQAMLYLKIKLKFFVWFTSKYGDKWTSICDKNSIMCYNGKFVGGFHFNILGSWVFTKANLYLE